MSSLRVYLTCWVRRNDIIIYYYFTNYFWGRYLTIRMQIFIYHSLQHCSHVGPRSHQSALTAYCTDKKETIVSSKTLKGCLFQPLKSEWVVHSNLRDFSFV